MGGKHISVELTLEKLLEVQDFWSQKTQNWLKCYQYAISGPRSYLHF